jgi:AcrR family transcriptional regulator
MPGTHCGARQGSEACLLPLESQLPWPYEMDELSNDRAPGRKRTTRKPQPKKGQAEKARPVVHKEEHARPDQPLTRGARSRMATRNKLIEAAHVLMAEKGFDLVTIEEITKGADVGFGSFYNHFESKDDIARAVFAQRAAEIALITDEISARETDKAVAISCIQKMFLTRAVQDPVWARFIIRTQDSRRQMNETFVTRASNDIRIGVEQKRFTVAHVETAADITIAGLISAMTRILAGGPGSQITAETVECMMRLYGIDAPEARRLAELPLPDYVSSFF